jgi:uncharacterized protein with GYD domain
MATYILLMTLNPAGQVRARNDPGYLLDVGDEIDMEGVETLGCYGVLGAFDFVTILEADSNEQAARFSLEMGVRGDVHITTLPAVPIARLEEDRGDAPPDELLRSAAVHPERILDDEPPARL